MATSAQKAKVTKVMREKKRGTLPAARPRCRGFVPGAALECSLGGARREQHLLLLCCPKTKGPAVAGQALVCLVEPSGIEPLTSTMPL